MDHLLNDIEPNDIESSQTIADPEIKTGPVDGNEYDYIHSFFRNVIADEDAAEKFTNILYEVSTASQVPVLDLLETMRDQDLITLTASMAFYLNSIRSSTTLVGVINAIKPNYYAAKNVLD